MKNDMKLIMESWRSSPLISEIDVQRPAGYRAGSQLTDTSVNPTDRKISDLIAAFETKTVEQMGKRYSLLGPILERFFALVSGFSEFAQSGDAQTKEYEDFGKILELVNDIYEDFKEFYEATKDKFTPGMTGVQFAKQVLKSGAEGMITKGPQIFAKILELAKNKTVLKVAAKLGLNLAYHLGVEVLDEMVPLVKKGIAILKISTSLLGLGTGNNEALQKALQAKEPDTAFQLMVTAALQVDDSKRDMLGPLKALDISDEFLEMFDKEVTAGFAQKFVAFLKRNRSKFMRQGLADDVFKLHVNQKSLGKFKIT
jgi:hypothetical protein